MFVFSVFLKYLSIVKDIAKIWIKSYTKQEKKEKISPIKKNILYFIEYKHIAKSEFCKKTGISYANLKGVGLGSEIGGTQLALILSSYPEIDANWLLTGNGEIIRHSEMSRTEATERIKELKDMISVQAETISVQRELISELKIRMYFLCCCLSNVYYLK